jgi:hypothetical protein
MTKTQMRVLIAVLILDLAIIGAATAAYLVTGALHWVFGGAAFSSACLGVAMLFVGRRSGAA